MRITPSRMLHIMCGVMLLLLMGAVLRQTNNKVYTRTCHTSLAFQEDLANFAADISHVLESLNLQHWLCYASLWGQLRRSGPLPWEHKVEICVRNDQLVPFDEVFLRQRFKAHGLDISYDSSDGQYEVMSPALLDAKAYIIVFEEDLALNSLRRVGWKRRMLPPDCEMSLSLHCFPSNLISLPLPVKEFGGHPIPTPREGIEMQKYHYPENWWKEETPHNC